MKRKFLDNNSLRHTLPFAAACFTASIVLFACADKDVETNENNGKALVAFNVSTVQDQAKAAAKSNQPVTRAAFAHQLAQQDLTPEDLTMQKLPVQGAAASSDICLIETTVAGVPSQWEDDAKLLDHGFLWFVGYEPCPLVLRQGYQQRRHARYPHLLGLD